MTTQNFQAAKSLRNLYFARTIVQLIWAIAVIGVAQKDPGADATLLILYPLWDVAFSRTSGWVRPYLQLSNLSNTSYEEIPGVAMPGRSVIGGLEFILSH